jgi:hypothetical protein
MKKLDGRADPGQIEFIEKLHLLGYGASVCVGFEAAVETIVSYLNYRG